MSLAALLARARDKTRFERIEDYLDFARRFLDFAADGFQATVVLSSLLQAGRARQAWRC